MSNKTKIAIGVSLVFIVLIVVWMWMSMAPPPTMNPSMEYKIKKEYQIKNSKDSRKGLHMAPLRGCGDLLQRRVAPPPKEDPLQAIDRVLEKMELGNIAFNTPKTMNLYDSAFIHLVLGVKKSIDDIKRIIEEEGEKVGARIRVSNRMEARLSGRNFEITAITPEVQAVARREVTEWKWEIKPRADGKQNLHLTLSALLRVEKEITWNFSFVISSRATNNILSKKRKIWEIRYFIDMPFIAPSRAG